MFFAVDADFEVMDDDGWHGVQVACSRHGTLMFLHLPKEAPRNPLEDIYIRPRQA